MNTITEIEKTYQKKDIPEFRIGDVVDVQIRLKEGEKERIQTFTGTVISRKGCGLRENFTVRRIVAGEGVERVFPVHSPIIAGIAVRRPGRARRAKLYYLRERVGKSTKTKERREDEGMTGPVDLERRKSEKGAAKKAEAKRPATATSK